MSGEQQIATDSTRVRAEEEVLFWIRFSCELADRAEELPPRRALSALYDALDRYLIS